MQWAGPAVRDAPESEANVTLIVVLGVCILSASAALYLLELDLPFGGLMEVSNVTLRGALPPL